ncbi:hypothetical protein CAUPRSCDRAFT_12926 [Caulochytrium protostelioides]|uniref:Uncharacterized protein n=1 Tax=Caulochytrium protostelioides TaxID=1555241 RepID=A0A4P9WQR4_9FUNG|nr:hypothetical protein CAUPRSCDRAFT_12926 [Caulochytrium protostelioides]
MRAVGGQHVGVELDHHAAECCEAGEEAGPAGRIGQPAVPMKGRCDVASVRGDHMGRGGGPDLQDGVAQGSEPAPALQIRLLPSREEPRPRHAVLREGGPIFVMIEKPVLFARSQLQPGAVRAIGLRQPRLGQREDAVDRLHERLRMSGCQQDD